jgi:tryptophan synthase alpha chain
LQRIERTFSQLKEKGSGGFIPFITAGDPDLATTGALLHELASSGAAIIELGVPFSDPIADGPVIQRASERALKHKFGLTDIFQVVYEARERIATPIVLFSYFNPLLQYGLENLSSNAQKAGVDGILVTDLIPEESDEFVRHLKQTHVDTIFLAAPTSTDDRLRLISDYASGFVYCVSRPGVTGTRENLSDEAELLVNRVRKLSNLPVAVGFGISTAKQVEQTWAYAEAAVVGSAIVEQIEKHLGKSNLVRKVGEYVRSLIPSSRGSNAGK